MHYIVLVIDYVVDYVSADDVLGDEKGPLGTTNGTNNMNKSSLSPTVSNHKDNTNSKGS